MSKPAASTSPLLILISAPSGAGKTTLCRNLLAACPAITRAVTCTTRAPRPGERDGIDYHFLTPDDFERRIAAGEFLEHANVYDNRYGTLKSEVLDQLRGGKDVLLNIDVQGAESVRQASRLDKELGRALVTVFLTPPTLEALEQRLRGRGTESPEVLQRRLQAARAELAHWERFDYLLLSDTEAEDLRRLQAIVEAERLKPHRVAGWVGASRGT
jgi:guanylate kinase